MNDGLVLVGAVVRATQELYRARAANPAAGRPAAAASDAALSLPARAMLRQQQQLGPASMASTPAATTPEPFNTTEPDAVADPGLLPPPCAHAEMPFPNCNSLFLNPEMSRKCGYACESWVGWLCDAGAEQPGESQEPQEAPTSVAEEVPTANAEPFAAEVEAEPTADPALPQVPEQPSGGKAPGNPPAAADTAAAVAEQDAQQGKAAGTEAQQLEQAALEAAVDEEVEGAEPDKEEEAAAEALEDIPDETPPPAKKPPASKRKRDLPAATPASKSKVQLPCFPYGSLSAQVAAVHKARPVCCVADAGLGMVLRPGG